ncbi:50S ribosomal protein L25 [Marinicrinis lubricantis]|uniref:Large ribosomal subunit protein bL25 n=1 Tax=Marinicrinis lubricantis TaxID=2086470 RepID=A0ABW1IS06_9BACL
MNIYFPAEKRAHLNTSGLRRLRRSGRLPGIVFNRRGHSEMIHISMNDFQKWLRQGGTGIIELRIPDQEPMTVLLEDVQQDPVTRKLLHVDFQRVKSREAIRTKIAIDFKGTPIGTKEGGIVQIQNAHIEVEALPEHLPPSIEMDVSQLNMGDSIKVQDVKLPPEVKVVSDGNGYLLAVARP